MQMEARPNRRLRCAIYTRNDHTALGDRVQDLFIPIAFVTR